MINISRMKNVFQPKPGNVVFDIKEAPVERWKYEILSNFDFRPTIINNDYVITHAQGKLWSLLNFGKVISDKIKEEYVVMKRFLRFYDIDVDFYMNVVEKIQSSDRLKIVFGDRIGSLNLIKERECFHKRVDSLLAINDTIDVYKRDKEIKVNIMIQNTYDILREYKQYDFLDNYVLKSIYKDDGFDIGIFKKGGKICCSSMHVHEIDSIFSDLETVLPGAQKIYPGYYYSDPDDIIEKIVKKSSAVKTKKRKERIAIQYFTYPFHYYGGADPSRKKLGNKIIIYVSSEDANILSSVSEVLEGGSGYLITPEK